MKTAWLLIALIAGILTAQYSHSLLAGCLLIAFAVLMRIVISFYIRRNPASITFARSLHYIWSFILFFGLGILVTDFNNPQVPEINFTPDSHGRLSSAVYIRGIVTSRNSTTKGERYNLKVLSINHDQCKNLEVILFADAEEVFEIGDDIKGPVTLRLIEDTQPDKPQFLAFQKGEGFNVIPPRHRPLWSTVRESISLNIEHRDISGDTAALIKALICADRRSVSKDRLSQFRDAGITHALAVSGMHVGIIATLMLWVTMPLTLLKRGRVWRYILAIAGVWIFAFVTGCAYSTLRAATMFTVAGIAWITERRRSLFAAVCSAGIVILLYSPFAFWDTGFRLSFICALSLAVFAQRLNPIDQREHPHTYAVFSACLVTLIATCATWMLVGYQFGSIPLNFIPSNLIILPLLPAYVIIAIIIISIGAFDADFHLLNRILDLLTSFIYKITELFNSGSLEIAIPQTSVILWLIGIAALGISLHVRNVNPDIPAETLALHAAKKISTPWLCAALAVLAASIITLIVM